MKNLQGRVYSNRFKKHAQSDVKNIAYQTYLGWSVPSLTVHACLSQYFVARGNSLKGDEKAKRVIILSSLLTEFFCHGGLKCVKKQ